MRNTVYAVLTVCLCPKNHFSWETETDWFEGGAWGGRDGEAEKLGISGIALHSETFFKAPVACRQ